MAKWQSVKVHRVNARCEIWETRNCGMPAVVNGCADAFTACRKDDDGHWRHYGVHPTYTAAEKAMENPHDL